MLQMDPGPLAVYLSNSINDAKSAMILNVNARNSSSDEGNNVNEDNNIPFDDGSENIGEKYNTELMGDDGNYDDFSMG